ncbi:MAG: ATP-binding protein [Nanoarchaeales archaeon]|nr:ATP-binding protein [Nanoarchaeales archaeon]
MKEELKLLIKTFHGKKPTELKKRNLDKIPLNTTKIISLIGSRRVGKTYSCYQIISELINKHNVNIENILYINFEDDRFDYKLENLDLIIQAYSELYPNLDFSKCYFFFDEIQEVDNWEKFIRRLHDTYTKNIFITGSSSKLLSKEISTSLRGRSLAYEIYPLSFKEYLGFNNIEIDIYNTTSKNKMKHLFEKYLKVGSFPEIINYEENVVQKTYQEYLNVMIFKDIVERYNIKNQKVLNLFIKKTISNIGVDFSINKFHNELKSQGFSISKDFLYELPSYLEDIFLVFFLEKYNKSTMKRNLASKKVYVLDSGFSNLFKFNEDYGRLLENLVFIELKRQGLEIYYHRDKFECDFIIQDRDIVSKVIQVTKSLTNEDTKKREINGLLEAMKEYNLDEGLILTQDEESEEIIEGKKITIMPVWKWSLGKLNKLEYK